MKKTLVSIILSAIGAAVAVAQLPPGLRRPTAPVMPRRPGSIVTPASRATTPAAKPGTPAAADPGITEYIAPSNRFGLKFAQDAPLQAYLDAYTERTGQSFIVSPEVPDKIKNPYRVNSDIAFTTEEYLTIIEQILSWNGIALEPMGERFIRVLPRKTIRQEGIPIFMQAPEKPHPERNTVISQMIQFKYIPAAEAQKALEGFKRPDGLFQVFERTNSILVTDTEENINRMLEIVKFIDQPLLVLEEVFVRQIKYAKAADVKKCIDDLVADSQKQQTQKEEVKTNSSGSPGFSRTSGSTGARTGLLSTRPLPPGLIRASSHQTQPEPATPNETLSAAVSDADRGMIRGKVQIIADERSNKIIAITLPDNMKFFDKVIEVLDVPTAPDVRVEIVRLKHATVEGGTSSSSSSSGSSGGGGSTKGIADILNELIGNSSSSSRSTRSSSSSSGKSDSHYNPTYKNNQPGGNQNLTSNHTEPAAPASPALQHAMANAKGKVGELSKENITILADRRINGLIIMASPSDLAVLKDIIEQLDIELAQVMIETVVIQVGLDDTLKTGIDWLLNSPQTQVTKTPLTDSNGNITNYLTTITKLNPFTFRNGTDRMAGGGGTGSSALGSLTGADGQTSTNGMSSLLSSGLNYFLKFNMFHVDINAIIQAAKNDARTKVLSSPILMTVDNREASIEATSMRYLYKGVRQTSSYYGTEVPDYEQRDIGLTVKVTPRINPKGTVVLTIDEKFETIGANQTVGTESYPTINTRKLQADVSVNDRQTIVLGGLVQTEVSKSESGIPILKDIPWIGRWLFGNTVDSETRSELLVFMTPYVFRNPEEAMEEAKRRKEALTTSRPWEDNGWSQSPLADPVSTKEKLRRQAQKWGDQDEERQSKHDLERARKAREAQLQKWTEEELKENAKLPPDKRRSQKEILQEQIDRLDRETKNNAEVDKAFEKPGLKHHIEEAPADKKPADKAPDVAPPYQGTVPAAPVVGPSIGIMKAEESTEVVK